MADDSLFGPRRPEELPLDVPQAAPVLCTRCKTRPGNRTKGSSNWCRPCRAEHRRQWRKDNLEKSRDQIYASSIRRRFGITLDEYGQMHDLQAGRCAICGSPESATNKDGTSRRLQIDHDHATGQIRELLCSGCNIGLGAFREDRTKLIRAVQYLTKWESPTGP